MVIGMAVENEIQARVSTRHGSKMRGHRLEVTFTDEEWESFIRLVKKSGEKNAQAYARKRLSTGRAVRSKVTPDDRRAVSRLSEIAEKLDELLEGMKSNKLPEDYIQKLDQLFADFDRYIFNYCAKLDNK